MTCAPTDPAVGLGTRQGGGGGGDKPFPRQLLEYLLGCDLEKIRDRGLFRFYISGRIRGPHQVQLVFMWVSGVLTLGGKLFNN